MMNLQNLFRKNLLAKALALVAAFIMWGYVMNEENPAVNASYTVPVEIVNAPEGYNVTMDIHEVTFYVRAPRSLIASSQDSDFKAAIDLSGNTEGEYSAKIKAVVPQGFELLGLSNDNVKVTMESLIAHGVPVDISVSGKAAEGMELSGVKPANQYVNVYGPRHLVESVTKASGRIKLAENNADFTMRVQLTAIAANGEVVNNLAVIPGELDVTVQLVPSKIQKLIGVKPNVVGILPEGYKLGEVSVKPVQIEVTGISTQLADINMLETKPISLANMTGSTTQSVELTLPEGITADNNKVDVSIEIERK